MIRVLQRHGADFSLTDQDGRDVAALARKENQGDLAELIESFKSSKARLQYMWAYRGRPENAEPITVVNAFIMAHIVLYYNVVGYTPHTLLLLVQGACVVGSAYCLFKLAKNKEVGSVIRNDFSNLQGSWSSAQNDALFAGLRICRSAKVAMPLRSHYSETSGNLVRRYHAYCQLAGVDICGENSRTFTLMVLLMIVDMSIAVYVGCAVISATSPDAPSIMLPHLFIWYGLWQPGCTLLTLLMMYSFFMNVVALQRLQRQVETVVSGTSMHEAACWNQYTYMQDPAGMLANPFDYGVKTNVLNFAKGKRIPEADMYSIQELTPKPWHHPRDKRAQN